MKCDQDLFLNLWYDLKKLLLQDELNPRVRSAFGNVSIFFDKIEKNIPASNNEIPAHVNTATQWQALRVGPLPRQSHLKNSNSLRRVLHSMRIRALYVWSTTRLPKHTQIVTPSTGIFSIGKRPNSVIINVQQNYIQFHISDIGVPC